jgi:hypothetical protein
VIIDVSRVCGEDIISRDSGHKIRDLILENWDKEIIELHFGGRTVGSVSFFDEAIGLLLKKGGKSVDEVRKKLKFPDLKLEDRTLLNYVVVTRIKESEGRSK